MDITAAELHALVEPLWKVWPDCVPLWLHYDEKGTPCWVLEGEHGDFGVIHPDTAAAIIRSAIVDALIELGCSDWSELIFRLRDKGGHDKIVVTANVGEPDNIDGAWGHCAHTGTDEPENECAADIQTAVLRALIAAALAVAATRT